MAIMANGHVASVKNRKQNKTLTVKAAADKCRAIKYDDSSDGDGDGDGDDDISHVPCAMFSNQKIYLPVSGASSAEHHFEL